ncbi:MAG TPA: YHS domain-containing protein [Roseiflexaceae bacterium]|nr:YHS domain-containing protein [Roseiflexaceae bacterium]
MERDPVCDMEVDPTTAAAKSEFQGQTYYFCSLACKQEFEADPRQYVEKQRTADKMR